MQNSCVEPVSYVLSLSYGKDSLACLFAIEQLGWPLDRIVHAEVWATDDIPADLPPMVEFKFKADKIIKDRWGIEVEHLCAVRNGEKLTYEKLFYHVPKRKNEEGFRQGTSAGFPYTKGAWCNDRLKTAPLDAISRGGGVRRLAKTRGGCGATSMLKRAAMRNGQPSGFPFTIGSWCKRLKDGSYSRLPDPSWPMVYQRPQEAGFLKAPLHKERRKILCSTSALRLMNRSELPDTRSRGSKCLL